MNYKTVLFSNEEEDYDSGEFGTGEHAISTDETGKFWGNTGAGGLFYCTKTNRFLVSHRSAIVNEPHTWGTWGGAIDDDETPVEAVKREVTEETKFKGKYKLVPSFIFKSSNFRYHNFIIIVNKEFIPTLQWESKGYAWLKIDEFPKGDDLHPGLRAWLPYLKNEKTVKVAQTATLKDTEEPVLNKYNGWVRPDTENLVDEYKREYIKHFRQVFGDLFPSFTDWSNAIKYGKIITITPAIRRSLNNASHAKSFKQIISLIKTYSSYPKFRNITTLEALRKRFIDNQPVFLPLIFEDTDGALHVVAGDTRLSVSNILRIPCKAIIFKE